MNVLDGKTALVTGAAGGIGRASAFAFAKRGAVVAVSDIDVAGAQQTTAIINAAGGRAAYFGADVSREADVAALIEHIVRAFGGLDFAHNNAGTESALALTDETRSEDFDRSIAVNLRGVFLCMKYELAHMKNRAGSVIVNTSSVGGLTAVPRNVAYAAAKHAVIGLTRTAAIEYAPGVRCVALCPGLTRTPMTERLMDADPAGISGLLPPLGRLAEPDEIGPIASWLCSKEAANITGQVIVADGGWTAR